MSILIKDMEMPKYGCDHCFLRTGNYCGMIEKDEIVVEYAKKSERHPDCPLVPVQPHGRLIDADALVEDLQRQCEKVFKIDAVSPDDFWITRDQAYNERLWKTWCESFFGYLQTRPTIIPAEEGE